MICRILRGAVTLLLADRIANRVGESLEAFKIGRYGLATANRLNIQRSVLKPSDDHRRVVGSRLPAGCAIPRQSSGGHHVGEILSGDDNT